MSLLAVEGLDAGYGLLTAVRQVGFALEKGGVLALVGANGAGKSTLLRTIAGAHRPSAGKIWLDGTDVTRHAAHTRTAMGIALVPEGRRLFAGMTVEENLRVAGAVGRPGPWRLATVLDAFPMLRKRLKARAGSLSGGEQQATAIGRALMGNPSVLLLDEVSLGLAPIAVDQVYQSLAGLIGSGSTIILVEQDLSRALGAATHIACMLEGRIVLEGRAEAVTRAQVTEAYFGIGRGDRMKVVS